MLIGFAEEFHNDAGQTVAHDEDADEAAGMAQNIGLVAEVADHDEEDHTFQQSFIQLTWVPGKGSAVWEDNAPWHIGGAAPQFSVDEICNAAKEEADRGSPGQ